MSIVTDGIPEARYGRALGRDDLSNQLGNFEAAHHLNAGEEAVQRADVAEGLLLERHRSPEDAQWYRKLLEQRTSRIAFIEAGIINPDDFWNDAPNNLAAARNQAFTDKVTVPLIVNDEYISKAPQLPVQPIKEYR